ncbi:MAG: hypothetical protein ACN6NX_09835, partial [Acinetobacter sp.]
MLNIIGAQIKAGVMIYLFCIEDYTAENLIYAFHPDRCGLLNCVKQKKNSASRILFLYGLYTLRTEFAPVCLKNAAA